MTYQCRDGGETEYSFNPIINSALDGGGWSASRPGHCNPGKYPVSLIQDSWMGLGAGLDRHGKSRLHRDSIPGPSSP
jgi:hypothetical protein